MPAAGAEKSRAGGMQALPPLLVTATSVAYFACVGLALRVGIAELFENWVFGLTTTRPGVRIGMQPRCEMKSDGHGYFFQNVVGCILMAAIARHKKSMNEHLAVGLASGLCGSLTTFATWMGEEAITVMNGYVFEALISVLCMLCVSMCSYVLGHHMAGCGMGEEPRCFDEFCGLGQVCCYRSRRPRNAAAQHAADSEESESAESGTDTEACPREAAVVRSAGDEEAVDAMDWGLAVDTVESWHEPQPPKEVHLHPAMELAFYILALVSIVAYVAVCIGRGDSEKLLDIAYAPFGALLRWGLSLYNAPAQKVCKGVPFFTLVANTLGCIVNAVAGVMAHRVPDGVGHAALTGLSTGFAGCLSTVSTLISELRSETIGGLRVRTFYFLLSFGLAMATILPIMRASC